jgi:hypothetical protein
LLIDASQPVDQMRNEEMVGLKGAPPHTNR